MARTFKDVPRKFSHPEDDFDFGCETVPYVSTRVDYYTRESYEIESTYYQDIPGCKTKKKRGVDTEWRWMTNPMWFVRLYMNQPQRTHGKEWERKIVKCPVDELIDEDTPSVGRKPIPYYW